jgi:hypothetical protein
MQTLAAETHVQAASGRLMTGGIFRATRASSAGSRGDIVALLLIQRET